MEALIQEMLDGKILLAEALREFEKIYIEKAVDQHDGHLQRSAETLGIHRNTLSAKLSSYREADSGSSFRPIGRSSQSKRRSSQKRSRVRAAAGSR